MIPKIIHFVWFGKKRIPHKIKKYIKSWRKRCPDYQIMLWNENNFDVNALEYTAEAYQTKSWAFLSDVVRLHALLNYGGIYLDTDVEVLKSFDELLLNDAFFGFEDNEHVATCVMGSIKGQFLIKEFLSSYQTRKFILGSEEIDMTPNVVKMTELCAQFGFILDNTYQQKANILLVPSDYFCPKNYITNEIVLTDNTYCIHHFAGSWCTKKSKFLKFIGPKATKTLVKIKHFLRGKHE